MRNLLRAFVALAAVQFGQTALASSSICELGIGDNKILTVTDWAFEREGFGTYLTLDVMNSSSKSFASVTTLFSVTDPSGKSLLNWELPRDAAFSAGQITRMKVTVMTINDKLETADRDDVNFEICLMSARVMGGENLTFSH